MKPKPFVPKSEMTEQDLERAYYGHCPVCGSDNVTRDMMEPEGDTASQFAHCGDCDISWSEVFEFTGIQFHKLEDIQDSQESLES